MKCAQIWDARRLVSRHKNAHVVPDHRAAVANAIFGRSAPSQRGTFFSGTSPGAGAAMNLGSILRGPWAAFVLVAPAAAQDALGPPFRVNTFTTNQQAAPAVSTDAGGGFV